MADGERNELCYILAPSYSGTTLLSFLLNTHPRIATVGELKAKMGDDHAIPELCSCGETMASCPFWQRVAADLRDESYELDTTDFGTAFEAPSDRLADRLLRARVRGPIFERLRESLLLLPGPRSELTRVLANSRRLIAAVLRVQGGEVFLDSSKDPIRLKLMLRSRLWNVRVVHLMRDGRATANSFKNWKGISMKKATLAWRRPHEQLRQVLRGYEDTVPCLRVRYEELATRPTETLKEVLAFLELEDRIHLDFRAVDHHILGNPMRLADSSEILLDERWRRQLTAADLRTFGRFGGKLNRRLGYLD